MQDRPRGPGMAPARDVDAPREARDPGSILRSTQVPVTDARSAARTRYRPVGVEYQVRAARITDIDRLVALSDAGAPMSASGPLGSADLMRQLVYLPQASIFIAESKREIVGGAVLALRPSVRAGGFVGTIDLVVVDPAADVERITESLLEEIVRSARNKGCTLVEVPKPAETAALKRLERHGFSDAGARMERSVSAAGTTRTVDR